MAYRLKNPLMKNSRKGAMQSMVLLRFFLRGAAARDVVDLMQVPKPTVHRFYEHARDRLFKDDRFARYVQMCMAVARIDCMTLLMNEVLTAEPSRLFGCVFHCPKDMRPKRMVLQVRQDMSDAEQITLANTLAAERYHCRGCNLRLRNPPPPDFQIKENLPKKFQALQKVSALFKPSHPMLLWVSLLGGLAHYRGITIQNVRQRLLQVAVSRAIVILDVPTAMLLDLPKDVAFPVDPIFSPSNTEMGPCGNVLETVLLPTAIALLARQ